MQIYNGPVQEMKFLLEVFGYDQVSSLDGYDMFDLETAVAMMEQHSEFCAKEMLPLNRIGDEQGVKFNAEDQSVTTPEGFKELYAKFRELGMSGFNHDPEYGGSGAPITLGNLLGEMTTATNKSFAMCPGLTNGLINALMHHGSDELKQTYLPKLVSGEWSGTMCLTEPQCGTDLGLISSKAIPEGDHYKITGTKIWITFGEHDMTENILHLVLARLPDAPEGIKGISLFLVPKFTLDGRRNPVFCGGLEHKMGIHASPTCVINMEDAEGYLVGTPHKGMRAMFVMMNHARLGVGLEGVALGEIAYQTALAFAKDRRQSRSLDKDKWDTTAKADNILVHPDVRRMLLNIKSTNEAMRAMLIWASIHADIEAKHTDEEVRSNSADIVALMTPIIKSYLTERGFQNIDSAMQVLGGSGYTTDWSIEQYMRDERIALIYEGTNHIQALDLVGRKLPQGMGRLFMKFNEEVTKVIGECKAEPRMEEFVSYLKKNSKMLNEVTMELSTAAMEDREIVGAIASNYLNLFAFNVMSMMWCRMALASFQKEGKFYETKIKTARYFFRHVWPEVHTLMARVKDGKEPMMDFEADEFWSGIGFVPES